MFKHTSQHRDKQLYLNIAEMRTSFGFDPGADIKSNDPNQTLQFLLSRMVWIMVFEVHVNQPI